MAGRKATPKRHTPTGAQGADSIRWVAEQLDSESEPVRKDAPTAAAWSLYQWASAEPKNAAQFWTQLYKGAITKEKPEENRSVTDDKRKFFRIFDLLEAERPELITNADFPRRPTLVQPDPVILDHTTGVTDVRVPTVPTETGADSNGQTEA